MRKIYEDRLVVNFYDDQTGKISVRGKRVGKDCCLPSDYRRLYVDYGTIAAVGRMKKDTGSTLRFVKDWLDRARGEKQFYGENRCIYSKIYARVTMKVVNRGD